MFFKFTGVAFAVLFVPLLAFGANGFTVCPMPPRAPVVNVTWTMMPLKMNYSKSFRELRAQGTSTITVPGYTGENALTEGLTVTKIDFGGGGSQLLIQASADRQAQCFSYDRIDMRITVDPTIYVAREVPQGTCHARAVLNHEMRHYDTVLSLSKRYRDILEGVLAHFVRETGLRGPYDATRYPAEVSKREGRLKSIVQQTYHNMLAENLTIQATIDNVAEYERVANLCRH